jgi:hypothetical protein
VIGAVHRCISSLRPAPTRPKKPTNLAAPHFEAGRLRERMAFDAFAAKRTSPSGRAE